jgi:hypothetical protein
LPRHGRSISEIYAQRKFHLALHTLSVYQDAAMNAAPHHPPALELDPEALVAAAFSTPRTPRSPEYKAGALALLRFKCGQAERCEACPHPPGTAAADAWFSGLSEGHSIFRKATQPA